MTEQLVYQRSFKIILLITISFLACYMALIYLIDPLQLFRKATFYQPVYVDELYQNPGIAKNYDYDTVIIGSSVAENFKPSLINQSLAMHAIKLTLQAANAREEKIILETALSSGNVKNVILGIDDFSFKSNDGPRSNFPYHLYHFSTLTDKLQYVLNIGHLKSIVQMIVANVTHRGNLNLEQAYSWEYDFSENRVINNWSILKKNHLAIEQFPLNKMQQNFDTTILHIIKNNPQVSFYLFYPPYSYLAYKKMLADGDLENFLKFKQHIFAATQSLANVKIFDFQTETNITTHLNNYKDIIHYSKNINDYMVLNFKNTHYLVTASNIDNFRENLIKQAKRT